MKKIIKTTKAPGAIGPYNQATVAGGVVYTSGQIAIDPKSGDLITSDIESETRQVLTNLKHVVEAAGSSLNEVLQCSVFVNDMKQYAQINSVYSEFFIADSAPARTLVEVRNLPKFVNIEISAIALINK